MFAGLNFSATNGKILQIQPAGLKKFRPYCSNPNGFRLKFNEIKWQSDVDNGIPRGPNALISGSPSKG
jgi:hypothetical protein